MFDTARILKHTFIATVECHATLTSTNDRAIQCAADGKARLPLLITAEHQMAGRGRGANRWWTGPGSLAFSLLLGPGQMTLASPRHSGLIAMVAGIAVADALAPLLPGQAVGIHWPNDVMAGDRKLTGILIESLSDGQSVVGIGVNTNNTTADAPPELRPRVGTLRDLTGRTHDATSVLVSILQHFQAQLAQLGSAPERVAARADALCLQRGRIVSIRRGEHTITGRCLGIAPDGALRLETPEGPQVLYSGFECRS